MVLQISCLTFFATRSIQSNPQIQSKCSKSSSTCPLTNTTPFSTVSNRSINLRPSTSLSLPPTYSDTGGIKLGSYHGVRPSERIHFRLAKNSAVNLMVRWGGTSSKPPAHTFRTNIHGRELKKPVP